MNEVGPSYFNPFSNEFHACCDFHEHLTTGQKVAVVAVTFFAGIASFFLAFTGGVAVFRLLVAECLVQNQEMESGKTDTEQSEKPNATPSKTSVRTKSVARSLIEKKTSPLVSKSHGEHGASKKIPDPKIDPKTATSVNQRKYRESKSVDPNAYKKFEEMQQRSPDGTELANYVSALEGENLLLLWEIEKRAAGLYKSGSDVALLQERLKIELRALSTEQLKYCIPLDAFWVVVTDLKCIKVVGGAMTREQLGCIGSWFKEHFLAPLDSEMIAALPGQKGGNSRKYLESLEDFFGQLVGHIPVDPEYQQELIRKMEMLCPHTTTGSRTGLLERAVSQKVGSIKQKEKRAELKQKVKQSIKSFKEKSYAVHSPSPSPNPSPNPSPLKKSSASYKERTQNGPPPPPPLLPSKPEVYQRKMDDAACRQWLLDWDQGVNQRTIDKIEHVHKEVLFWILDRIDTHSGNFRTKMTVFIACFNQRRLQSFTQELAGKLIEESSREYSLLEAMSGRQLKSYVEHLEGEGLEALWKWESMAASSYSEPREKEWLKDRLLVELRNLSVEQLEKALTLDDFWRIISVNDYKKTAGVALMPEHFGAIAKWLKALRYQPDSLSLNGGLLSKLTGDLRQYELYFKCLIEAIPSDDQDEKTSLGEVLRAVCSYATKETKVGIEKRLLNLTEPYRKVISALLKEALNTP